MDSSKDGKDSKDGSGDMVLKSVGVGAGVNGVLPDVEQGLAILRRTGPAHTLTELREQIKGEVHGVWLRRNLPTGLCDVSRKYNKKARLFGGLNKVLEGMVRDREIVVLNTPRQTTVLFSVEGYTEMKAAELVNGVDLENKMLERYHSERA